ncbi:MAG: hypothetical protein KGJ23_09650 [Euryarchaeota archaeon]|nr:hypothetical protein [Euryarchaeota archaeon]MDE1836866.1 hypothetical protein [Euryarchaeota archaeon]MDE1879745.1 hypothetical protein [Euryarchaeota archaeon]MDE2046032.1 hypothetical protein [Thermoplasmata archaeon]
MRLRHWVAAAVAYGLFGVGVGLVLLTLFSSGSECSGASGTGGGSCTFVGGVDNTLGLIAGLALMLGGFATIPTLPRRLTRPALNVRGPGQVPGVVLPIPGGVGVWLPSAHAPTHYRLPNVAGQRPPVRALTLPRSPSPQRQAFARYTNPRGEVFPLPGGLGIWVPATRGPLRSRTYSVPPDRGATGPTARRGGFPPRSGAAYSSRRGPSRRETLSTSTEGRSVPLDRPRWRR